MSRKLPANIYTPNVEQGKPEAGRYRLYRHDTTRHREGRGVFSITPKGKTFTATVQADDCGAGCRCAAFLTDVSDPELLARARRF